MSGLSAMIEEKKKIRKEREDRLFANEGIVFDRVRILSLLAVAFIVATFFVPMWRLQLEAPQYETEGPLRVQAHIYKLNGDIWELSILNEYIGAHFPEKVPEQYILPVLLGFSGLLLFLSSFMAKSKRGLLLKLSMLLLISVVVLGPAVLQWRLYQFGHYRDPNPPLTGIPDFTVPVFGPSRFAQWTLYSSFVAKTPPPITRSLLKN